MSTYDKVEVMSDTGLIGDRQQFNRRTQLLRITVPYDGRRVRLNLEVEDKSIGQGHLFSQVWINDKGWTEVVRLYSGDNRLTDLQVKCANGVTAGTYHPDREVVAEWTSNLLEFLLNETWLVLR